MSGFLKFIVMLNFFYFSQAAHAKVVEYNLVITKGEVEVDGEVFKNRPIK